MTLGEKIQELRKKQGISQDALAEQLEVSRQAVSKWERDEAVPETDKIIRLARLFGVTTDYLLTEEDPAPVSPIPRTPPVEERIMAFMRRHGYKSGYVMMGLGAFICIMSIAMWLLWPVIAGGFLSAGTDSFDSGFSSHTDALFEGLPEDLPQDIRDEFLSQNPVQGFFDDFDDFGRSSYEAMQTAVRAQSAIFLIGLIPGILLLALGLIIVVKGKKLAHSAVPAH